MLNLWPQQSSSLVIGHRGAMGYAPENTLVSFEDAIRRGADLIEMDVQLSQDGKVVVMHDTSVDRTTDGSGVVRDLPWRKIQALDAGVWYGPEYAQQCVPCLEDVIAKFRHKKTANRHALGFVIELKTIRGSGGSLADSVVALLQKEEFTERCIIISFDSVALQEVRAAHKTIPTGLLFNEENEEGRIAQAKVIGAQAIFPKKTWVTTRGVATAHKVGLSVGTWTCNTKNEMERMMTCGVDAIVTNFPDRLRAMMK